MNEATQKVLEAALAFASALAANGAEVPDHWHNWIVFKEDEQTNGMKGHPEKLLAHAQQLQAALDAEMVTAS